MAVERVARKRQRVSHDDDDGKKTRGRPRVEGADETAADVRHLPQCPMLLNSG
jgi:hypothetical protein